MAVAAAAVAAEEVATAAITHIQQPYYSYGRILYVYASAAPSVHHATALSVNQAAAPLVNHAAAPLTHCQLNSWRLLAESPNCIILPLPYTELRT